MTVGLGVFKDAYKVGIDIDLPEQYALTLVHDTHNTVPPTHRRDWKVEQHAFKFTHDQRTNYFVEELFLQY